MKAARRRAALLAACSLVAFCAAGEPFEDRWVYVSRNLTRPEHVQEVADIVRTAKSVDLNGMLFSCGVDRWHTWPAERKARLAEVKRVCDEAGVEIIPIIWSVGYGGYDPAYAAALPCTNVPFVVKGGKAVFSGGGEAEFANPGFDEPPARPNCPPGWWWTDKPGKVSFIDTEVKASGRASLRLENYGDNPHGHGRACHLLKVNPGGCYRVSCLVRSEGVEPTAGVLLQIYIKDGVSVSSRRANLTSTQGWTRVERVFNAAGRSEFRVYAGIWGGKAGRLWLDDFRVEDMGCASPLVREGLPFEVRDARTGASLRAGVDFDPPPLREWNRKWNCFRILHGGAAREGAELTVDYWTAAVVANARARAA